MGTVRDFMQKIDARIFKSPIVEALASFGSTENLAGAFHAEPREIVLPGGDVMFVGISFECQYIDEIGELIENADFTVEGYGTYRFLRELQPGGDESGLTTIELGEKL